MCFLIGIIFLVISAASDGCCFNIVASIIGWVFVGIGSTIVVFCALFYASSTASTAESTSLLSAAVGGGAGMSGSVRVPTPKDDRHPSSKYVHSAHAVPTPSKFCMNCGFKFATTQVRSNFCVGCGAKQD